MGVSIRLNVTQNSQNVANNTSNVTVKLICSWDYGSFNRNDPPGTVTIDGTTYSFRADINPNNSTTGSSTIYSKTLNISHNSEGKKTLVCDATFNTGLNSGNITAPRVSKVLTTIPRAAFIVSADNFTDEENPLITYSNPAGSAVTTLRACISLDGSKDDIAYRDIGKNLGMYAFELTEAERNILRKATQGSNSRTVRFYIMSVIGGVTYRKYLSKTFTVVNANPTISPSAVDVGSVSTALTGDANKIISGYNNIRVEANASPQKEATISSYKITCGGASISSATGNLRNVTSGKIVFTATDSRGNTVKRDINKTLIDYKTLTCDLVTSIPNAVGEMDLTIKGNYFNGSFGAVNNTLTVQYRYKVNEEEYGDWIPAEATVSGSAYTANVDITGLDYQNSYTFQARAMDAIYNGNTEPVRLTDEQKVKTTPVFDWGENDFSFHVPVILDNSTQIYAKDINGEDVMMMSLNDRNQTFFGYGSYEKGMGQTYFDGATVNVRSKSDINLQAAGTVKVNGLPIAENRVIFNGAMYMQEGQTIMFNSTQAINKQAHGIVLVFSAYENGAAVDKNFNCFYVPKWVIAQEGGSGFNFVMGASCFGNIASKYIYITNTSITGNADNIKTGTAASGITYTNNAYVLRYVIGV